MSTPTPEPLTAFGVFGLLSNFDAFDATVFQVRSFAMLITTFRLRNCEMKLEFMKLFAAELRTELPEER